MIDIIKLFIIKQIQFGRNRTKLECFGQYLTEKSGTDWNLNRDKNDYILFYFLNRHKIFRPFQLKQSKIYNYDYDRYRGGLSHQKKVAKCPMLCRISSSLLRES